MYMHFIPSFQSLRLDIVSIVAVLGEGSVARNAQASGCTWFHVLPRLMPAPQALLAHHQVKRLPTAPGIVVGAYSGRIVNELNFFTQLLHNRELTDFEVELVKVQKHKGDKFDKKLHYNVKTHGHLASLSILGCAMSMILIGLSLHYHDGPALLATILLTFTSTTVGFASKWRLKFPSDTPNKDRKGKIPDGDVVIFYPKTGAFRVVRCDEEVSRLYFNDERCYYWLNDGQYRWIAFVSTVALMSGLIFIGSAQTVILQTAFVACYVVLNALYWGSSALNPTKHVWKHNYQIEKWWNNVPIIDVGKNSSHHAGVIGGGHEHDSTSTPVPVDPKSMRLEATFWTRLRWKFKGQKGLNRVNTTQFIMRDSDNDLSKAPTVSTPIPLQKPAVLQQVSLSRAQTGQEPLTPVPETSRNMTTALWTAIALTGTTRWVRTANIAPDHEVWDVWLKQALLRAAPKWSETKKEYVSTWREVQYPGPTAHSHIELPLWNHQRALKQLFEGYNTGKKMRPVNQPAPAPEKFEISVYIAAKLLVRLHRARKRLANPHVPSDPPANTSGQARSPTQVQFANSS